MKEFDIHLRVRVQAEHIREAAEVGDAIVEDLLQDGETYSDRPINGAICDRVTQA